MNEALREPAVAESHRDFLRGVYGMVKDCDGDIRFSFFTGVSKFSKVSLFSDLNNLTDITLDPRFAAICGYTDEDLSTVFAAELQGLRRDAIRDWYNGYNWRGREEEKVYNPYGMLLFQEKGYAGGAGGAEKHRDMDLPIHQVAVTFSEETRNIAAFEARSL